jgi:hypothetical protein
MEAAAAWQAQKMAADLLRMTIRPQGGLNLRGRMFSAPFGGLRKLRPLREFTLDPYPNQRSEPLAPRHGTIQPKLSRPVRRLF